MNLNILFVEDADDHMMDLVAMLEAERQKITINITPVFARDLAKALDVIDDVDAVVTDVFLPSFPGGEERPNGMTVVEKCLDDQKPVVWCTSTYHHGRKTNAPNDWGRERGLEMFDCSGDWASPHTDGEGAHKPWRKALYGLLYLVLAVEEGEATFVRRAGKTMILSPDQTREVWPQMYNAARDITDDEKAKQDPVLLKMRSMVL
jgi:CheY-like chemotaxis protein